MTNHTKGKFTVAKCPDCSTPVGQVLKGTTCYCRKCYKWFDTQREEDIVYICEVFKQGINYQTLLCHTCMKGLNGSVYVYGKSEGSCTVCEEGRVLDEIV